jgi:hypothetical protein
MRKYRVDRWTPQEDGARCGLTLWMGGPSLAEIQNCRLDGLAGEPRANVFITGEPDTFFSIPAVCSYKGCRVRGYVTCDDAGNNIFRHVYY